MLARFQSLEYFNQNQNQMPFLFIEHFYEQTI